MMTVESDAQEIKTSPMMLQWQTCKVAAGDAILFFRMGEAFYEDAALIAKELDLTLTKRQEIPMSGVPFHTAEPYIDKLVGKGYKVAVAEQTEDPKLTKGLVRREVVRIVTPGTVINSTLLSDKANNYCACVTRVGSVLGLSFLDLTTAEFRVIEFDHEHELLNEIYRLQPAEFLVSAKFHDKQKTLLDDTKKSFDFLLNVQEDWRFDYQITYNFLTNHFKVHSLDGFGLKGMTAGINAAGALLSYLQDNLCLPIEHISEIHPYTISQYLTLDRTTQRNLELTESLHAGNRKHTLLGILDKTHTPMGARLLRHWIKQPLLSAEAIHARQDAIQAFMQHHDVLEHMSQVLDTVKDIQRLMMKISAGYATPRDLLALRYSFEPIPLLKQALSPLCSLSILIQNEEAQLHALPEMTQKIAQALVEDPPLRLSDGNVFRDGYHPELDELRTISRDSKSWIASYQTELRETTGIKTLKVGFTKMFGYYIEISKGQAANAPSSFIRRQTLVNAERFITPELKDYEGKVLNAEERMGAIEAELFMALRQDIARYIPQALATAQAVARIDVLHSLASVARLYNYARPLIDTSRQLKIEEGRHPVIEAANIGHHFIPNDTLLDDQNNRLLLITGPNMAGKSTYIRQVALLTIMAQMGSFIPAKSAHIGIVDKVFTRIGASDDLSRGHSTFMVEMSETANILHNATDRSLVILDEIGRGTSTYDGISIAWAVAEHLLTVEGKQAKTLFATHYWELTKLEEKIPGAVNYNVAVQESQEDIIFLRKIVRGGTDKSYGIHVGRLAGLPIQVIARAQEILVHLEENANRKSAFEPSKPKRQSSPKSKSMVNEIQLSFFASN
jgi:DNA mismatch repair protein MutS